MLGSAETDTKVLETGKRIKTDLDLVDAASLSLGLIVSADQWSGMISFSYFLDNILNRNIIIQHYCFVLFAYIISQKLFPHVSIIQELPGI